MLRGISCPVCGGSGQHIGVRGMRKEVSDSAQNDE